MPKIDEDFMRELISQGVPGKQDVGKQDDVPQETLAETAQAEKPTPRKRRNSEKLMRIVTVIGGRKVTVSSYVENILLRHFEQYQDEINTLYENNFQKPF